MTLADREFFESATRAAKPRFYPTANKVGTLAAQSGAPTLVYGTPLAWDTVAEKWSVYTQPSDAAIFTVTNTSTDVDGGTFEVVIDGLVVVLAWNTTAAAATAAINAALLDAGKPYTVSSVCTEANLGVAAAVLTVTFSENAGAPTLTYDGEDTTDGGVSEPHTFAVSDAGTQLTGLNQIRGFIGDVDGVLTSASGEVQVIVLTAGRMDARDINTAAIRALLGGSPSEAELNTALRSQALRTLGFTIEGLTKVN